MVTKNQLANDLRKVEEEKRRAARNRTKRGGGKGKRNANRTKAKHPAMRKYAPTPFNAVVCNQIFEPAKPNMFAVIPSSVHDIVQGGTCRPRRGEKLITKTRQNISASASGHFMYMVNHAYTGFNNMASILNTSSPSTWTGGALPTATAAGSLVGSNCTPLAPRSVPSGTDRNEVNAIVLGQKITITANWSQEDNLAGIFRVGWVEDTQNMSDNVLDSLPTVKTFPARLKSKFSINKPPIIAANDHLSSDTVVHYGTAGGVGYSFIYGAGVGNGTIYTVEVETSILYLGTEVNLDTKVYVSQQAYDCADSCMMEMESDAEAVYVRNEKKRNAMVAGQAVQYASLDSPNFNLSKLAVGASDILDATKSISEIIEEAGKFL